MRDPARKPRVTTSPASTMGTIVVNGSPRALPAQATVAGLVVAMGLEGKRIAVERNGEIVPRSRHADTVLVPGDRVEIVGAVGGG
jgi:sulfur carrier protein